MVVQVTKPKLSLGDCETQNMTERDMPFYIKRILTSTIISIGLILIVLLSVMLIFSLAQPFSCNGTEYLSTPPVCTESCTFTLAESIPENLTYPAGSPVMTTIYENWLSMINSAQKTLDIASFYWTLLGEDVVPDPSDWQGEAIFQALLIAGTQRGVKIRIVQSMPTSSMPDHNTERLEKEGAAEVRSLDFNRLLGGGVLHTKLWIADNSNLYLGSANMDWRALTQIKELGAVVSGCPCLADDVRKIFEVYWYLGVNGSTVPSEWPKELSTTFNEANPMQLEMNDTKSLAYLSSSPPSFCPTGRTSDIESIIKVISEAKNSVCIAVMDYFPLSLYTKEKTFWPVVDNLLRQVAIEKQVHVRLLASYWNHTRPIMINFLNSLSALNSSSYHIETKLFVVPDFTESQAKIPFSRVAHNKYMVTDQHVYIGTSNWSEDYFTNTAGVGFILSQTKNGSHQSIKEQLQSVFDRDWNSEYAKLPSDFNLEA